MTMYLPNPDVRATGYEPGEFIEALPAGGRGSPPVAERGTRAEAGDAATAGLDVQTRIDITRSAEQYIAGLVENRHGGSDDVRAVIRDLDYHANVVNTDRKASL